MPLGSLCFELILCFVSAGSGPPEPVAGGANMDASVCYRVYVDCVWVDENAALGEPSGTKSLDCSVDSQKVETMTLTKLLLRLLVSIPSQCQTMRSLYVIFDTKNCKTKAVNYGGN